MAFCVIDLERAIRVDIYAKCLPPRTPGKDSLQVHPPRLCQSLCWTTCIQLSVLESFSNISSTLLSTNLKLVLWLVKVRWILARVTQHRSGVVSGGVLEPPCRLASHSTIFWGCVRRHCTGGNRDRGEQRQAQSYTCITCIAVKICSSGSCEHSNCRNPAEMTSSWKPEQ